MATITSLPAELKSEIVSHCEFPTIVTLLRVNTEFHSLTLPTASDSSIRLQFLLDYESSPLNRIYELPKLARQTIAWHEQHQSMWQSKHLYICFLCNKLRRPEKFAQGQCYRMMLPENYSSQRKRFCIDCGTTATVTMPRKYVPGAMITCSERGYGVLLCGDCGLWTPDFYCMSEKKCFECTEKGLSQDSERFVEGGLNEDGARLQNPEDAFADVPEVDRNQGVISSVKNQMMNCPKRPPYCRSCGGHWRYTLAPLDTA
ncbi:hypothetical protein BP6252_06714 [Coleophoma cylindrospora]|uniref:F-box domain-containing protein n=1 Tax=Coleophoma cylindrospora TaxID=1849047 RepID=A0A3D8RFI7_9HELO|nr:hypothetical protein BP6252_06714 [Coleophoma cylindrospora]